MIPIIPGDGKPGKYFERPLHSRKRFSLRLFISQESGPENLKSRRAVSDEKFCWYTRIYPPGIDWDDSDRVISEKSSKQKNLFIRTIVLFQIKSNIFPVVFPFKIDHGSVFIRQRKRFPEIPARRTYCHHPAAVGEDLALVDFGSGMKDDTTGDFVETGDFFPFFVFSGLAS